MSLPASLPEPAAGPEAEPGSVLCLPEPSQWGMVWVMLLCAAGHAAMALLAFHDNRKGSLESEPERAIAVAVFGAFALLGLSLAGGLALRIRRGFIAADALGIRWRGAGRVREAKWQDVRDYYFGPSSSSPRYAVETAPGRLSFGAGWSNSRDLSRLIERHALDASAREWRLRARVLGQKDAWPRRFSYRTFENRCLMPLCVVLVPALLACLPATSSGGVRGAVANLSQVSDLYGWPLTLLMVSPVALMFAGLPLMACLLGFHGWRGSRRRWNESIEATREGISWTDGESTVASTWGQVRGFSDLRRKGLALPLYEVHTERGSFSFTSTLGGWQQLLLLLQEHAPNIPASAWRAQSGFAQEPPIQNGSERVFHYCNSSMRLLAWSATMLLLMPLAVAWIQSTVFGADPDLASRTMPWPTAAPFALPIPWLWWRYQRAAIRTDRRGITQAHWRGERFLAWESIGKYLLTGEGALVVEGHGASGQRVSVRFFSCISGADELMDEIERRAIHASNREWSHRSTRL